MMKANNDIQKCAKYRVYNSKHCNIMPAVDPSQLVAGTEQSKFLFLPLTEGELKVGEHFVGSPVRWSRASGFGLARITFTSM